MNLRSVKTIWMRELRIYYRDKSGAISSMGRSLLWLFIFGGGLGAARVSGLAVNYQEFIFPGVIAMTLLFTSIRSGITVIWDREFGFLKEILVSPASRTAIMAGKVLGTSTIATGEGLVVLLLAPLIGINITPLSILYCLPVMLLMSFTLVSIGLIISTLMKTFEGFQTIMNLFIMPMYFLSGALFPINQMPSWMAPAVAINPATYGVDALRQIVDGAGYYSFTLDIGVLIVYAAITIALGVRAFNSRD